MKTEGICSQHSLVCGGNQDALSRERSMMFVHFTCFMFELFIWSCAGVQHRDVLTGGDEPLSLLSMPLMILCLIKSVEMWNIKGWPAALSLCSCFCCWSVLAVLLPPSLLYVSLACTGCVELWFKHMTGSHRWRFSCFYLVKHLYLIQSNRQKFSQMSLSVMRGLTLCVFFSQMSMLQ